MVPWHPFVAQSTAPWVPYYPWPRDLGSIGYQKSCKTFVLMAVCCLLMLSAREEFGFTNRQFFRYLQTCHAFTTQFGSNSVLLLQSSLESLLRDEHLAEPTSNIYKALFPLVCFGLETLFSRWQSEVPDMDAEDWEDAWEYATICYGPAPRFNCSGKKPRVSLLPSPQSLFP